MSAGLLDRRLVRAAGPTVVDVRAGRIAAALALTSAGVHVLTMTASSTGSLVMALMALLCLPCARHLWTAPTTPVWALTALLDVGMLAVHATLVLSAPHHGPASAAASEHVHWTDPACLALLLVAGSLLLSLRALSAAARTGGRRDTA